MGLRNLLPSHKNDIPSSSDQQDRSRNKSKTPSTGSQSRNHKASHKHGISVKSRTTIISHNWHNQSVAALAEFAGTFMFLFFAFGGTNVANNSNQANSSGGSKNSPAIAQAIDTGVLLYISLVFGFSLMVNVWCFFRVSGGLFNPAVSLFFFDTTIESCLYVSTGTT
jgi:aquaporin related protein